MERRDLETLDYFKILEQVANYAHFDLGRERVLALRPTSDPDNVRGRLARTREAVAFLARHNPDLTGAADIRESVRLAARGRILSPGELLQVRRTVRVAENLRRAVMRERRQHPRLARLVRDWPTRFGLVEVIDQVLDEEGRVLDTASPELAAIRRGLRETHRLLRQRLEAMVRSPDVRPLLQEPIITLRAGRYVLPVKAEHRSRFPGIVHDQSGTGATYFIEPFAVVDLNNRLRTLEQEEEREIRRLLKALSQRVGRAAETLVKVVERLADLDMLFARARYALEMDAVEPRIEPFREMPPPHPGSTLRLYRARHPLIPPERVVPVDIVLEEDVYALVITGPNTGGKTVTLKTVGLLALMAQSGLFIPAAEGSALSVFRGIYADIGDEQSIEQSLSTFSAHIRNIIRILEKADRRSLVLLDELGAGTDPHEGAALAWAILDALVKRGVTTLVATHYPELKVYAHRTPGVQNASMEFDPETLQPTYRLLLGLPGRSNALIIARRLGLDAAILREARKRLTPEERGAEDLLAAIQEHEAAARKAREEAERLREELARKEAELQRHLERIEEERRAAVEEARSRAREEAEALRRRLKALERRWLYEGRREEEVEALRRDREQLEAALKAPTAEPGPSVPETRPQGEPAAGPALEPGARVYLPRLRQEGVVLQVEEGEVEVQVGTLRLRVSPQEVRVLAGPEQARPEAGPRVQVRPPERAPSPGGECHLRGMTVEDALETLERYLEQAYLAGLPWVRIVHGKGTGRLREAVRDFLRKHPLVVRFRGGEPREGGEGVTIAWLESD